MRNIQAPKELSSLGVAEHSEGGNTTFVSCQFCDQLDTMEL